LPTEGWAETGRAQIRADTSYQRQARLAKVAPLKASEQINDSRHLNEHDLSENQFPLFGIML
jgi:hypothetical protein